MADRDAVLFANSAFYAAFAGCDLAAMDQVWAKNRPVTCIHPGWEALSGRQNVMRSWRAILGNPEAPEISCRAEQVAIHGDIAVVTCIEQIEVPAGAQFLAATNVFCREGTFWGLVHHHAGAMHVDPRRIEKAQKPIVN